MSKCLPSPLSQITGHLGIQGKQQSWRKNSLEVNKNNDHQMDGNSNVKCNYNKNSRNKNASQLTSIKSQDQKRNDEDNDDQ